MLLIQWVIVATAAGLVGRQARVRFERRAAHRRIEHLQRRADRVVTLARETNETLASLCGPPSA